MAGVLLHPTSLPGIYGIGELGDHLIAFLDWASSAGIRVWQVLPLNPPGYGASPYGCLSAFAGNPLLISVQRLMQEGLLDPADVADVPRFSDAHVEFDRVAEYKFPVLRLAWQRFQEHASGQQHDALARFVSHDDQNDWLNDYTLFMTLKEHADGAPWWEWEPSLAARDAASLEQKRKEHEEEIRFWEFLQFLFFRQWAEVHDAARARDIRILGDVPIYVAADSAEVWSRRDLFYLDDTGQPIAVAGVPPDYFSPTGQRWGNPLFRWDVMRENGYDWWIARVRANLRTADMIRLDHFRGFAAYWEIAASEPTAVHGRWMPGPGIEFFDALHDALGSLPFVAEDLGFITDDVHELRRAIDVPGMRVLQFGFEEADSPHLPHRYEPHTVVYTGTHDNDTARGWFENASIDVQETVRAYLGCSAPETIPMAMIRAIYSSVAEIGIVPAQDILALGSDARMNTPGNGSDNWGWRFLPGALTPEQAVALRRLATITGRV
jgi:4-alpha-glucanotransferase